MELMSSLDSSTIFESYGSVQPDQYFSAKILDSSFWLSCRKLKLIQLQISSQRSTARWLMVLALRQATSQPSCAVFEEVTKVCSKSRQNFSSLSVLCVRCERYSFGGNTLETSYFSSQVSRSSGQLEDSHRLKLLLMRSALLTSFHQLYSSAFFSNTIDSRYLNNFLLILAIISKNSPMGCSVLQYSQKVIAMVAKQYPAFSAPASSKEEATKRKASTATLDSSSISRSDILHSQSIARQSSLIQT